MAIASRIPCRWIFFSSSVGLCIGIQGEKGAKGSLIIMIFPYSGKRHLIFVYRGALFGVVSSACLCQSYIITEVDVARVVHVVD